MKIPYTFLQSRKRAVSTRKWALQDAKDEGGPDLAVQSVCTPRQVRVVCFCDLSPVKRSVFRKTLHPGGCRVTSSCRD